MSHAHSKVVEYTWMFSNHPVFLKKIWFVVSYLLQTTFYDLKSSSSFQVDMDLALSDLNIFQSVVASKININFFQKGLKSDSISIPITIILLNSSLLNLYLS